MIVKRDLTLKLFEHQWEEWRTKQRRRTYRLVCSRVSAYRRRKHKDF